MTELRYPTISTESHTILQDLNLDGLPDAPQNYIRLRRIVFRHSSDGQTWDEKVDIPIYLDSVAALQFLGFKKSAAREILESFDGETSPVGLQDDSAARDTLINLALCHVRKHMNVYGPEDDWLACLKNMGIKKSTREAICNPEFDWIRYTRTARDWAEDTIEGS